MGLIREDLLADQDPLGGVPPRLHDHGDEPAWVGMLLPVAALQATHAGVVQWQNISFPS